MLAKSILEIEINKLNIHIATLSGQCKLVILVYNSTK